MIAVIDLLRLAEDQEVFVDFVYAKRGRISERTQVVIFLAPIPDDQVIKNETNVFAT